jgi:hypothetical protein
MPQHSDPIYRDLQRLGFNPPPPPRLPDLPPVERPVQNPTTPLELAANLPAELRDNAQQLIDAANEIPEVLTRTAVTALTNVGRLPAGLINEVIGLPCQLVERLAPENVNTLVDGLVNQLEFRNVSPAEFQTRVRTFTDVVPFL